MLGVKLLVASVAAASAFTVERTSLTLAKTAPHIKDSKALALRGGGTDMTQVSFPFAVIVGVFCVSV